MNIENTFEKLDEIIKAMESSGVTLEESLNLYKEAAKLIENAETKLTAAKAEVDRIAGTEQ
jgi:exodeoxyribonuclease VII small subunit